MEINKSCKLFLRSVYSYDIPACHFTILENIEHPSVPVIKNLSKLDRNIQIGLLMKSDPNLTKVLRSSTISTIDDYISTNQITDDELITRQYDGFLCTKKLKELDIGLSLKVELRNTYSIFIISSNRDSYITTDFKDYSFKGISNRYDAVDEIYKKILNINFLCRSSIFSMMDKLQKEILHSDDPSLYFIPSTVDKNFGSVILKNYGDTKISQSVLNIIDCDDIDRQTYYDKYFRSFFESILIEFL